MNGMFSSIDPYYLVSGFAIVGALALVFWLMRRPSAVRAVEPSGERLDTLAGWPPEAMRIMRSSERLAFSTLKLALPGYLILAQVPVARFVTVPKRNSYAEWMRRIGSQCVDFVICDVTSQVVSVVEVRPPLEELTDKVRARFERMERTLDAAGIPVHVWNEQKLPSIEAARAKILPNAPAVPPRLARRMVETAMPDGPDGGGVVVSEGESNVFADTDQQLPHGEIIDSGEVREPNATSWFDELDSDDVEVVSAELPRTSH
ncbi:MAG: DUF2726 domain-containing protein [Pseudomonadota bacterium]|nr:DUF2726 domain-containing protein [Pseudomonadota bacterium]